MRGAAPRANQSFSFGREKKTSAEPAQPLGRAHWKTLDCSQKQHKYFLTPRFLIPLTHLERLDKEHVMKKTKRWLTPSSLCAHLKPCEFTFFRLREDAKEGEEEEMKIQCVSLEKTEWKSGRGDTHREREQICMEHFYYFFFKCHASVGPKTPFSDFAGRPAHEDTHLRERRGPTASQKTLPLFPLISSIRESCFAFWRACK